VILRLLRGRIVEGEERNLAHFFRDEAIARALKIPGLLSFQPAIRESEAGIELVIVSTWSGFDDMAAASLGVDQPLAIPELSPMVVQEEAEHYELVIGEARAMPLRRGKLRLTRIPIKPNHEAGYYAAVRPWAERLLDETSIVSFTLGRRVVGRQDEIVAIQIFEDEAALREAAGADLAQPMGRRELSEFWAGEPAIEHFDALTAIEPRPDAPAILLADDSRRYVHATPAAARLSGRPLARLLTMRVEDITRASERAGIPDVWDRFVSEGTMEGPYVLARPDGSEVEVRFAAKANAPWPGSHASLLVPTDPAGEDEELDVDEALAEAGLVARYSAG
jgi:PAS domain-containing protein